MDGQIPTVIEQDKDKMLDLVKKDAAIVAAKLRISKQAAIRTMASNIYGHLHGDKLRSEAVKDELVTTSVKAALAIWHEVDRQV